MRVSLILRIFFKRPRGTRGGRVSLILRKFLSG
jgi:hypothetical protein